MIEPHIIINIIVVLLAIAPPAIWLWDVIHAATGPAHSYIGLWVACLALAMLIK